MTDSITGKRKKHRNKVKARRALRALMASYNMVPSDKDVYPDTKN